jgi:hypothetical protein
LPSEALSTTVRVERRPSSNVSVAELELKPNGPCS